MRKPCRISGNCGFDFTVFIFMDKAYVVKGDIYGHGILLDAWQ